MGDRYGRLQFKAKVGLDLKVGLLKELADQFPRSRRDLYRGELWVEEVLVPLRKSRLSLRRAKTKL